MAETATPARGRSTAMWVGALAVLAALAAIGEGVERWRFPPDRLDRILAILERDPELLWRLRAGLSTTFENAYVRTNDLHLRGPAVDLPKPPGRYRVVCLGASPTFGWGVGEPDAYPAVVGGLLRNTVAGAEVLNGGVPGYTSWQGRNFLESRVLAWSPDAVTVAYDLNDLDRFRFFQNDGRPDGEQRGAPPWIAASQNLLNRAATYRLFRRALMGVVARWGTLDAERLPRRVSIDAYRENLRAIAKACAARGVGVVFLKMPVHLPFDRLRPIDPVAGAALLAEGIERERRGDPGGAADRYAEALRLTPGSVPAMERAAALAERRGDVATARRLREFLPFAKAFRDRIDLDYNRAVDAVGAEVGVPVVDVVAAFARDGRGDRLWNSAEDPFHPNAAGHRIIGELVAAAIVSTRSGGMRP
jgi:lysophospholipase L1-like esterase